MPRGEIEHFIEIKKFSLHVYHEYDHNLVQQSPPCWPLNSQCCQTLPLSLLSRPCLVVEERTLKETTFMSPHLPNKPRSSLNNNFGRPFISKYYYMVSLSTLCYSAAITAIMHFLHMTLRPCPITR